MKLSWIHTATPQTIKVQGASQHAQPKDPASSSGVTVYSGISNGINRITPQTIRSLGASQHAELNCRQTWIRTPATNSDAQPNARQPSGPWPLRWARRRLRGRRLPSMRGCGSKRCDPTARPESTQVQADPDRCKQIQCQVPPSGSHRSAVGRSATESIIPGNGAAARNTEC